MLKNYKHILIVVLVTVIHFEAVAQSPIYKDVLLDGKPAKLNTVTGEVKLVSEMDLKRVSSDTLSLSQVKTIAKDSISKDNKESNVKAEIEPATALVYEIGKPELTPTKTDHTVKEGETLYGLSRRYAVTLRDLMRANNLETTLIKTGQILRVQNFEDLFNSDTWTVVKGDTLYNISKRTNTTIEQLMELNNLSSSLIKIGQVLRLK